MFFDFADDDFADADIDEADEGVNALGQRLAAGAGETNGAAAGVGSASAHLEVKKDVQEKQQKQQSNPDNSTALDESGKYHLPLFPNPSSSYEFVSMQLMGTACRYFSASCVFSFPAMTSSFSALVELLLLGCSKRLLEFGYLLLSFRLCFL